MKIYRNIHFLSLDAVIGALASSCFASRLFGVNPGWVWWLILGMTAWWLYTGDRMRDAWRHRKKTKTEVHTFMLKNRKPLNFSLLAVAVVDFMLIINLLDKEIMKYALVLAGLVLLFSATRYLLKKNSVLHIPGEVFVLFLYLAGTWLGPAVAFEHSFEAGHGMIALIFAGILLMNLGVISLYDTKMESKAGLVSIARQLGARKTRNMVLGTAIAIYLISLLQFLVFEVDRFSQFAVILSGMATIYLLVLYYPSRFRKNDYYRLTAEAVLFMGFLSLFIK